MKMIALILGLGLLCVPSIQAHDECYYDPYAGDYYDYSPYNNYGVYSTGYYFSPNQAYQGSYEEGYGVHVPTGTVSSPYYRGVHHGYHWSEREGWHRGTHYGSE